MNATAAAPKSAAPAQGEAPAKNQRTLMGRVTSTKMQKTGVVRVERRTQDPFMGKTGTPSRKYHAHVENGEVSEGGLGEIAEVRSMSKNKPWGGAPPAGQ